MQEKAECEVFNHVRGLWAGNALVTAYDLGMLGLLWESSLSTENIADRLSLDPRGARALISTLQDIGMVEHKDGSNVLTSMGRVVADPEGSLFGYLEFHALLRRSWAELPKHIQKNVSHEFDPNRSQSPEVVMPYIRAMDALGQSISGELATVLNVKPGDRVLDLGGGSSIHARAILARQPQAYVTVVDRPIVVRLVRESLLVKVGIPKNLKVLEGDYRDFDGKQQFDWVLLANVIHNEHPEDNKSIIDSCARALKPGGQIAIVDYFSHSGHERSAPAGFDLLLLLMTQHGRVYGCQEIAVLMNSAGFESVQTKNLHGYELAIARKVLHL